MNTLTGRITEDNITATAAWRSAGAPSYTEGMGDMDWWDVTLDLGGRLLTVPFGMGSGLHGAEPTAHDVLSLLLSDAAGAENSRGDFDEWAGEYGYSTDSRSAERTYRQVVKSAEQLRTFLDDKYDAYLWETEQD
jgi:hypothetical protein